MILSASDHEYFGQVDLQAWTDQAPHWIARAWRTAAMTAPASRALLERLAPRPGERVLDVAAGCGDPALAIAALVGPTGAVTATDAIPEMLVALDDAARAAGLRNVTTLRTTAEALDVAPGSHDAACCRFGVMFFADPLAALTRIRRAVRPDGRLVVMAWSGPAAKPYFGAAMEALDAAGAPPLQSPPGLKTVFEFSEPGRLAALAGRAGWQQVREEEVRFTMDLPDTPPDGALDALAQLSTKVQSRLEGLDAEVRERARAAVAERVRPHAKDGALRFPAVALLVSGRA